MDKSTTTIIVHQTQSYGQYSGATYSYEIFEVEGDVKPNGTINYAKKKNQPTAHEKFEILHRASAHSISNVCKSYQILREAAGKIVSEGNLS
jgi:hypothetical protein